MAKMHDDVEYQIESAHGSLSTTSDADEAMVIAMHLAMSSGSAQLDVLVWSEEGARAYGGSDAVDQYREDPEASVFERFEVSINAVGRVA